MHLDVDMKPIGYWLKELDRLIEAGFADVLAAEGLTRRHWQVLNVLAQRQRDEHELDEALAPFGGVQDTAETLVARGWIARQDEAFALTAAGDAALERVGASVHALRARVTDGIAPEEYATTVHTLRQMAGNLTR
jgi:DNA-binding MarR family transcriptional regulator